MDHLRIQLGQSSWVADDAGDKEARIIDTRLNRLPAIPRGESSVGAEDGEVWKSQPTAVFFAGICGGLLITRLGGLSAAELSVINVRPGRLNAFSLNHLRIA